jgi:hypothetical protein
MCFAWTVRHCPVEVITIGNWDQVKAELTDVEPSRPPAVRVPWSWR